MATTGGGQRPLTLRDIAKAAGVSVAAVSQALNGTGALGPETRARIRATASELGYAPNQFAAALRRQRSMAIAYVTGTTEAAPSRRLAATSTHQLNALVRAAAARGFNVTVLPENTPELLASSRVEAVYAPEGRTGSPLVTAAISAGLPVMSTDTTLSGDHHLAIDLGLPAITEHVLERFWKSGSHSPALLLGEPSSAAEAAIASYLAWCDEHGVAARLSAPCTDYQHIINESGALVRAGADAVLSLAENGPVVFIGLSSDETVLPRDVQLVAICVDECEANQRLDISHVCIHPDQAPELALGALTEALRAGEGLPSVITVPWELHERSTTRPRLAGRSARER